MQNKILILFLFMAFIGKAQDLSVKVNVVKKVQISAAERDSYVVPSGEWWEVTLTDGTRWRNNGGLGWVEDTGGGSDGNDYLQSVTMEDELITFDVTNQTNPTLDVSDLITEDEFAAIIVDSLDLLLPRDGSRPMTGDIDMDENGLIDVGQFAFRQYSDFVLNIQSDGGTGYEILAGRDAVGSSSLIFDYDLDMHVLANGFFIDHLAPASTEMLTIDSNGEVSSQSIPGGAGGPYLPLSGGTMTGDVDFGNNELTNIGLLEAAGAEISVANIGTISSNTITVEDGIITIGAPIRYGGMTSAPTALEGQTYFDDVTKNLMLYDGTEWIDLGGSATGDDDQTASEVPIVDSGLYFTATDVEGALQELGAKDASDVPYTDTYSIGETDVQGVLDYVINNGPATTTNTTSFKDITTETHTLVSADRSTSSQSQRLQFNYPTEVTVSEPVSPTNGEMYRLVQYGLGQVKTDFYVHITANDSIYAMTEGIGSNMVLEYNGNDDYWTVTGSYETYTAPTPPSSIYDGQNAADPVNEVDGVADTDGNGDFTVTSEVSPTPQDGAYFLMFEQIAGNNTAAIGFIGTELDPNTAYTITLYANEISGTNWQVLLDDAFGWVSDFSLNITSVGVWTKYELQGTTDGGSNHPIRVSGTASSDLGDLLGIDFIVIEETP